MLKAWYAILFAVSAALLLISMTISLKNFKSVENQIEIIRQTRVINHHLYRLQSRLHFAESASRAYLMSKNESFLTQDQNNEEIEKIMLSLDELIGAQKAVSDQLLTLKMKIRERILNLDTAISLVKNQSVTSPDSLDQIEQLMIDGTALMHHTVTTLHDLIQREDQIGSEADQQLFLAFQHTLLTVFASFILSIGITLVGFILLQREISHRHQADKLKEEKNREILSNRRKSEFMANMSHEIRTPLNSILGFAELLGKDKPHEENTKYLTMIQTSAQDLHVLVNDILDLSRIESGKFSLNYEPTYLMEIANTVYSQYLTQAENQGLQWKLKTNSDLSTCVHLDPGRVRQILNNLITNAFKFTEKGEIELSILSQFLPTESEEQRKVDLTIQCRDTGVGIDEEDQELIFSPFEQASKRQEQKVQLGSGLGLSITKKLVEMMGGTIKVESQRHKGSVFIVHFPRVAILDQPSTQPQELKNVDFNQFPPLKILVADDHPYNREVLIGYLKNSHHQLFEATDGIDAIAKAQKIHPDCILMDSWMPKLDGIQTLKTLKRNAETQDIVIIAQTAFTLNNVEEKHRKLFDGYLGKPFTSRALHHELSKHFPINPAHHCGHSISDASEFPQSKTTPHQQLSSIPDEIRKKLSEEWSEKLSRLISAMPMLEIKDFTRELLELSQDEPIMDDLYRFAKELENEVENFEIIKVEQSLSYLYNYLTVHPE